LGWDIGWDQVEQRTRYPGASVNDEGVIVNKIPSIFLIALDSKGRLYVVKVTYGPKTDSPLPGVEPNGKQDFAD
jgi:hypothetical protein